MSNNIYLMASEYGRFHSELGLLRTGPISPVCERCGYPDSGSSDGFRYFWDTGMGSPGRSIQAGHSVFWCELAMLITSSYADAVVNETQCVLVMPTECMASEEAVSQFHIPAHECNMTLARLVPACAVDIFDPRFRICSKCGKFADEARRVSRLHCRKADLPACGIFRINQNRGYATFVTDFGREAILRAGLRGIAFHSAGRVIG